ncbi:hypothetical protein AS589_03940 [Empedobacter brevis]|uniref:hypothetical protein n=1 Tax=Empedobacter brevis TaxID=247 RepID=UPI00131FB4A1|nr:hypothetical protein [Empedobacter brevis]QHC84002.1 hypothetical protein AS589_03940 [Empedobacter brevis]
MEHEYFKNALYLFLFGLGTFIFSILFHNPFKKKKINPDFRFGLEQKEKLEYSNEQLRRINETRIKGLYIIGIIFIISSIVYLILGIIEYF